MCQTSFSARNRVPLRVLISTLVFQQLVIPGYGSQNYFEILKEDESNAGQDTLMLNDDIFKCNIDKACDFVMKYNNRYLLSTDPGIVKEGIVGETVWIKMAVKTFMIQHSSGKCLGIRARDDAIIFTSSCNESFILTDNASIQHVQTGLCMIADGNYNGALVRLQDKCNAEFSRYKQTDKLSLQNVATGGCLHPHLGGHTTPKEGLELVFYYGCNEHRLRYDFIWD